MNLQKCVLTEREAAEYVRMSRSSLRQSRRGGSQCRKISSPPYIKIGRSIRYFKADLDQWLRRQRVAPFGREE
ncbi:MAG: DNA-binding protein [Bradymonadales bacterium]|nr:MAG: DNA-binding protein [Bradymonadales bacterium]